MEIGIKVEKLHNTRHPRQIQLQMVILFSTILTASSDLPWLGEALE